MLLAEKRFSKVQRAVHKCTTPDSAQSKSVHIVNIAKTQSHAMPGYADERLM
jgi:hypothetical protein